MKLFCPQWPKMNLYSFKIKNTFMHYRGRAIYRCSFDLLVAYVSELWELM